MKPDLSKLKYRIGDKVLYKGESTEIIAYTIDPYTDYTIRHNGLYAHTGRLHSVDELGNPLEFDDHSAYYVRERYLTLIKDNTMTLNDLKNFDIITTRDGRRMFVYEGIFINIDCSTNVVFRSNFTLNMKYNTQPGYDIMKVERMGDETSVRNIDRFMRNYLKKEADIIYKTIYQHDETTELTMQQIADKFGIPVESLKIKK